MEEPIRVLRLQEWSEVDPGTAGQGAVLRGLELSERDRAFLRQFSGTSSLAVTELREGLAVSVGPHIGTVELSTLRIVVVPKIGVSQVMKLVAYAFGLSDLSLAERQTRLTSDEEGLTDVLGEALLRAVERLVRGGLLPQYQARQGELATPRGRIDMRAVACRPPSATLPCRYTEFTVDYGLNRCIAAGLRHASRVVSDDQLRFDLASGADRFFGDLKRVELQGAMLRQLMEGLDRRSSHYRDALYLVSLIYEGSRVSDHTRPGDTRLSGFMLNMNTLFERFLERYLKESAGPGFEVITQDVRHGVFRFVENEAQWQSPYIKPDLVLRHRGSVVAVADAKYKNRLTHRPSSSELYQLATYGLSYDMASPREVLLLHPLGDGDEDRRTTLLFDPPGADEAVRIRLVGVPIDGILGGEVEWWPF